MHALGWKENQPTRASIDLETVLLWVPDIQLKHIQGFAKDLQESPLIAKVKYEYSNDELFQFMQYLASYLTVFPTEPSTLLKVGLKLKKIGPWMYLCRASMLWLTPRDYPLLLILGDHYKEHCSKWAPHKRAQILTSMLSVVMHFLNWEAAENKDLPRFLKESNVCMLEESAQISLKHAVFSWIPKKYFSQEKFFNDLGRSSNFDPSYSNSDIFNFMAHLQKLFSDDSTS
jgi:hypothetical protein